MLHLHKYFKSDVGVRILKNIRENYTWIRVFDVYVLRSVGNLYQS